MVARQLATNAWPASLPRKLNAKPRGARHAGDGSHCRNPEAGKQLEAFLLSTAPVIEAAVVAGLRLMR
jgi:hypothetical protein